MPSGFDPAEFDFIQQPTAHKTANVPLTRIGDLLNEPSPEYHWVVDNLLLRGGFSLLCGKPKSGKSSLSRCLSLAVARGQPFLGRKTIQGGVILFSLEDHRYMLKESFQKLGAMGDEELLIHCGSVPGSPIRQLEAAVERHRPALVIVDTVFRFTKCFDTNSYTQVLEALTPLSDLARDTGIHLLAVHHAGKAERTDSLDSVLGSVAVHGSMDCTLLLRRTPEYRVIESQQRYGADLEPTTLNFNPNTGWLERGLLVKEVESERLAQEILDFLSCQDDGITEQEIAEAVGGKTETKRRALRNLVEAGQIRREGRGGRGDAFRYRV